LFANVRQRNDSRALSESVLQAIIAKNRPVITVGLGTPVSGPVGILAVATL
jgi:hypothetical protein